MQMSIDKEKCSSEIKMVFPLTKMPENSELTFHSNGCRECDELKYILEGFRGKEVTGEVIGALHQSLSLLSPKSYLWILPYYMSYCLSSEAEYNQMEAQFLIYNLRPSATFLDDTKCRLSLFNPDQIQCIREFLNWCRGRDAYKEYCKDIDEAIIFLQNLKITT